ncbi:uncharacterized protein LOC111332757 [Stylophora pistillata]|nr:uncharacterized protein LOC111332757 [Stylophora pistillata]
MESQAFEVEAEIQITDLKDVYDKKTKKTNKGHLEYSLEDSKVSLTIRASDEITGLRAYTQRCAEAAIKTRDVTGPVELEVNITQGDAKYHLATVDLGSVYRTQEGDTVYRLEKADVVHRNKWELLIALEFKSGLRGMVKSRPFRVTTKASFKMKRDGVGHCLPKSGTMQRIIRKFKWSDINDVTELSSRSRHSRHRGMRQECLDREALNRDFVQFTLEDEDGFATQHTFAERFMTQDSNHISRHTTTAKVLLRNNTALDTRAVTAYYSHNPKIDYVVEEVDTLGMLKLVRKKPTLIHPHGKGRRRKSIEGEFWWACGYCFFERRKKSTIKAHIMQRVCQKPLAIKSPHKKKMKRQLSHGDLEECEFDDYSWKASLSV